MKFASKTLVRILGVKDAAMMALDGEIFIINLSDKKRDTPRRIAACISHETLHVVLSETISEKSSYAIDAHGHGYFYSLKSNGLWLE